MERPAKRPRTGPALFDDEEVVGDELNHQPEEVNQLRDPGYHLEKARNYAAFKLKSAFENIFEKYGKDFEGIGDEIDLRTGEIVVDNGHIKSLKTNTIGVEDDDEDESEFESENEEETSIQGQAGKQNVTALQAVPRPLPSMVPPSSFSGPRPIYNSFGRPPSAFGGVGPGYNSFPGGPPPVSNMMYPGQTQYQPFPLSFGAFSSPNDSVDPTWRVPDLPQPVPWGGFWTPGTQPRIKTVAKVQQLIGGTNRDQEGEDEDDILLDVSTTETIKAAENTPAVTKKLATFRPPSIVSSPANHQFKKPAATSTPKSVGKPDAAKTSGEKKKTPKRKTPAKKTPAKTSLQSAAPRVVHVSPNEAQPIIGTQPTIERTPDAENPSIEGQRSVVGDTGEVKGRRTPNRKTTTSDTAPSAQNADILLENLAKLGPAPAAVEDVTEAALESETQPVIGDAPGVEERSSEFAALRSKVEVRIFKDTTVGTDKVSKRKTPTRRNSTREQVSEETNISPSGKDDHHHVLSTTVEQHIAGAEHVVDADFSVKSQSGSAKPPAQETTVEESVVEETTVNEGPVSEIELPSAQVNQSRSSSMSAMVNESLTHHLEEVPSSDDPRTERRKRRLSVRDRPSPVRAGRSLEEERASRYERSLFNGESNAKTTLPLQYYSPRLGELVTKPSNQQLWVDIPVDGTLDPKAFQVVVDDDTLISEIPALELGEETADILTTEELAMEDVVTPPLAVGAEAQKEVFEGRKLTSSDPPKEVFTRNVVDSAYAFSDEDEPAIPKAKVRRLQPAQPNPKPKAPEKLSVKELGLPTPGSSFDHSNQTTESDATSHAEIPMEELPVITNTVITETNSEIQSTGSTLLDKTNSNSEELLSVPKPVQVSKPKRGRPPGRKPKPPLDLGGDSISPVVTSTPTVAEKPSKPAPLIDDLVATLTRRQSLRLSRGRRDSDVTIAESTTPQHAKATAAQHEESLVIQESPQATPEPEHEPEDRDVTGGPASPTLSATVPTSPKLTETSAPEAELPEDSFLGEAVARQRFWSPKPESVILGYEPSPPERRRLSVLEVQIPSRRMSLAEPVVMNMVAAASEPEPRTSPSPQPQEPEPIIIEDIQPPQPQPEQPTTPLKAKPRRVRPPSAASLPTATITTTTKIKTKSGPGPSSVSKSAKRSRTPSTTTRTTTTTAATTISKVPTTSGRKRTLTGALQGQSQAHTPGTSKSTKSILSLISSDTDDEDELTLDFGTPSAGAVDFSSRKRGRPRKSLPISSSVSSSGVHKPQSSLTTMKKTSTSLLSSSSLLRTPSRKKKTTSLGKIASSISIGKAITPAEDRNARAATPSAAGSEAGEEDFVGSEVIQTPGGTLRRCGEAGFRCDRDFCFGCL